MHARSGKTSRPLPQNLTPAPAKPHARSAKPHARSRKNRGRSEVSAKCSDMQVAHQDLRPTALFQAFRELVEHRVGEDEAVGEGFGFEGAAREAAVG